jgi:hypothetical protein
MTEHTAGGIVMLARIPHVVVTSTGGQHAIVVPIKRRRADHHRADLAITLPGYGRAYAACHKARRIETASLPKRIATLTESVALSVQIAVRTESETQARENAYQPVRLHTSRAMNNVFHER